VKRLALLFVIMAARPAAGSAQAQAGTSAVVSEILAYQDAATEAFRRGDSAAVDSLLADDFTLTGTTGERTTKWQEIAGLRSVRFTVFRNVEQQVRLYDGGRAAIVTGRTLIAGESRAGGSFDQDVTFTDTLVRIGGRWRMVASHASPTPRAPKPE
jgi:ketosteroid isomerase-like protein